MRLFFALVFGLFLGLVVGLPLYGYAQSPDENACIEQCWKGVKNKEVDPSGLRIGCATRCAELLQPVPSPQPTQR